MAKGFHHFHQQPALEYNKTFPLAIKPVYQNSGDLSLTHNYRLKQIAINNVFLNVYLEEETYISEPM